MEGSRTAMSQKRMYLSYTHTSYLKFMWVAAGCAPLKKAVTAGFASQESAKRQVVGQILSGKAEKMHQRPDSLSLPLSENFCDRRIMYIVVVAGAVEFSSDIGDS